MVLVGGIALGVLTGLVLVVRLHKKLSLVAYGINMVLKEGRERGRQMEQGYSDFSNKLISLKEIAERIEEATRSFPNVLTLELGKLSERFAGFAETFDRMMVEMQSCGGELEESAQRILVQSAGLRASFGILAGRMATLSKKDGVVPEWFKTDSRLGRALALEDAGTDERIEFIYENGGVTSRTYCSDRLVCEVLHDEFGGLKEGTMFDANGKPKKRFVYDRMEQERED